MIGWIAEKLMQFFSARRRGQQLKTMREQNEVGTFRGKDAHLNSDFESDYNAATGMLKTRMNTKFPDNFHAQLGSRNNNTYDYGAARVDAVDQVSTTIAMALRNGATVRQAAEAGAACVGI